MASVESNTEGALIRAGASSPPSSAGTPAQIPTAPLRVPPAPSTGFLKDLPDLQTVNPSPSSPVAINSAWPIARRTIASIYNRLGGLMSAVARKTQVEVPAVLAVWKVEGGNLPHNPGKAVIRFENHLLYRLWGKNNDATYAQYFRHGGYMGQSGNSWENHQYRENPNQPFRSSHSNQDAEYLVLSWQPSCQRGDCSSMYQHWRPADPYLELFTHRVPHPAGDVRRVSSKRAFAGAWFL